MDPSEAGTQLVQGFSLDHRSGSSYPLTCGDRVVVQAQSLRTRPVGCPISRSSPVIKAVAQGRASISPIIYNHTSMVQGHAGVPQNHVNYSNTLMNAEEDQCQSSNDAEHFGPNMALCMGVTINSMKIPEKVIRMSSVPSSPEYETLEQTNELIKSDPPSSGCSVSTQSGSNVASPDACMTSCAAFSMSTEGGVLHEKSLLSVHDFGETLQNNTAASEDGDDTPVQETSNAALGDLHAAAIGIKSAIHLPNLTCFVSAPVMPSLGEHCVTSCGSLVSEDEQPHCNVPNCSLPMKLESSIAIDRTADSEPFEADGVLAFTDITPASLETPKSFRIMESSSPGTPVVCGFSKELPSELDGQSCTLEMPMLTRYFIGRRSRSCGLPSEVLGHRELGMN